MKYSGYKASEFPVIVDGNFDLNSPSPPSLPTKPVFRETKPTYFIESSFFRTFFIVLFISGVVLFFVLNDIEKAFFAGLIGSLAFSLLRLFVKFLDATDALGTAICHCMQFSPRSFGKIGNEKISWEKFLGDNPDRIK